MRTLLLLLTTVLVAYVPAVAQDAYILHPITRGFSPATDINDHGVAVGWWIGPKVSEGINTESGGYIWTKATGPLPMITDPAVVHMFPFYAGVNRPDENLKINAANEIAGIGCPEGCGLGFFTQAAVWSSSRGLTLLESFDGFTQQSGAAAINDAFLVVGYNWSGAGSNGPFRWTPAGGMQPLPVPGSGSAYDVNERGDIVGICLVYCGASQTDAPYQSAFYWSPDTGFAVIPHLPGSSVAAGHAINDLGVVVGMNFVPDNSGLGTGEYRIVRWSASTGLEDLSAPTGLPERIDINNDGDIVATILVAGVRVPYLYREGVWTDLNVLIAPDSGFRLGSVTSINNRGWMTGEGTHGGFDSVGFVLEPANRAPVASSSVLSTYEDTAISGVMAASDADGDVLNYEISTIASKGIVTIIDATTGAFLYTPFLNANGADAFTFSVSDGHSASGAATVTVNIAPVNDPPIAENGAIDVMAGVSIAGTLSAFDIDGPTLTYTILDNGTKGSVVVDAATGSFTYTAAANSIGTDAFTFAAWDGVALSNEGLIAINITPAPPCAAGECPGAIDALINEVNALSLRLPAKRLLVRTLDTARTALERGRELQAIALLRVFIAELQVLQRTRLLSGATASPLITSARAIIDSVEG